MFQFIKEDSIYEKLNIIQNRIIEFGNKIKELVTNNKQLNIFIKSRNLPLQNAIDIFTSIIMELFKDVRVVTGKEDIYYIITDVIKNQPNLININSEKSLSEIIKIQCINIMIEVHQNQLEEQIIKSLICSNILLFEPIFLIIAKQYIKNNKFDSNDINNLYTLIKRDGIKTFNEFGSSLKAFRSIINDELTKYVTLNRNVMDDLLKYSIHINTKINDELKTNDINYLILKGGNMFKLIKEEICKNKIYSDVFELKLRNIDFTHMREYINNKYCREVKPNGIELSDWDFTIDFNIPGTHEMESDIFTHDPAQFLSNPANKYKIDEYINEYNTKYNIIRSIIIRELYYYRNNNENHKKWDDIYTKIIYDFNSKCNIKLIYKNDINDTYVYPVSYTSINGKYVISKKLTVYENIPYRHNILNETRKLSIFNELYKNTINIIDRIPQENTHLRISNMEIFGKSIFNGNSSITGFDLIRYTLNFYVNIKLFNTNINDTGFYTNQKVYFAELLDYSFAKPITVANFTHGHNSYEFATAIYKPNYNNFSFTKHPSYSIIWFINDIIDISLKTGISRKFSKRLVRMYDSIIYFMILYEINGYSIIDFTKQINITTGKNLLETLITIKDKAGDFGFEIFQKVRNILHEILNIDQNNIGGKYFDNNNIGGKYFDYNKIHINNNVINGGNIFKNIINIVILRYPITILLICILILILILNKYTLYSNKCYLTNNYPLTIS